MDFIWSNQIHLGGKMTTTFLIALCAFFMMLLMGPQAVAIALISLFVFLLLLPMLLD
jgi:hypothetical protein